MKEKNRQNDEGETKWSRPLSHIEKYPSKLVPLIPLFHHLAPVNLPAHDSYSRIRMLLHGQIKRSKHTRFAPLE